MSLGLNRSGIILATSPRLLGVRISRVTGRSCGRKFRGVGTLTRLDLDMLARERKPLGFSRTTSLFASQMAVRPPHQPRREFLRRGARSAFTPWAKARFGLSGLS
jgi:hypothetical protein